MSTGAGSEYYYHGLTLDSTVSPAEIKFDTTQGLFNRVSSDFDFELYWWIIPTRHKDHPQVKQTIEVEHYTSLDSAVATSTFLTEYTAFVSGAQVDLVFPTWVMTPSILQYYVEPGQFIWKINSVEAWNNLSQKTKPSWAFYVTDSKVYLKPTAAADVGTYLFEF
jgi:hypothetical protein